MNIPNIPTSRVHDPARFATRDTNHDGTLTVAEFVGPQLENPLRAARLRDEFIRRDTNQDGKLSFPEFTQRLPLDKPVRPINFKPLG